MKTIKYDSDRAIRWLLVVVAMLTTALLIQTANLQEQRKQTVAQAELCIKTTSDAIANYQLALMRQQQAHKKDIDDANKNIEFLLNEYNKLIDKTNKSGLTKREHLSIYSYLIHETAP